MRGLRLVVLRALNKNQVLILSNVGFAAITELLQKISEQYEIPLSTLRLNAKILRELELISFNGSPVRLTRLGGIILKILNDR